MYPTDVAVAERVWSCEASASRLFCQRLTDWLMPLRAILSFSAYSLFLWESKRLPMLFRLPITHMCLIFIFHHFIYLFDIFGRPSIEQVEAISHVHTPINEPNELFRRKISIIDSYWFFVVRSFAYWSSQVLRPRQAVAHATNHSNSIPTATAAAASVAKTNNSEHETHAIGNHHAVSNNNHIMTSKNSDYFFSLFLRVVRRSSFYLVVLLVSNARRFKRCRFQFYSHTH